MLIIDKNTDYYDYISHVYGEDKRIVFDRRNSRLTTDNTLIGLYDQRYLIRSRYRDILFVIEIGRKQYLIRIMNPQFTSDEHPVDLAEPLEMQIEKEYSVSNICGIPINITAAGDYRWWSLRWSKKGMKRKLVAPSFDEVKKAIQGAPDWRKIELPILKSTSLTSLFTPEYIWMEIQNYISSLDNDKNTDTSISDKEKAETHGFNEQSFRHPVK